MSRIEFDVTYSTEIPKLPGNFCGDVYFERISPVIASEMLQYSTDRRLYEFLEYNPFENLEQVENYVSKLLDRTSNGDMYWCIRSISDSKLIGTAGLSNINSGRRSAEWGYGIDPEYWGKGLIYQVQEILKNYAFGSLELNRLSGITLSTNTRTIQSVLAAGMLHEGTLQQYYCKDGCYIDGWLYGMCKGDYFAESAEITTMHSKIEYSQIVDQISKVLPTSSIDINSNMETLPEWDSINHMGIILTLQEGFSCEFSPLEISNMTSVSNILKILTEK